MGDKTKSKHSPQKYTVQLNLDQNSSSHVSWGVIGFDWRRISKTVRDWINQQEENFSRKFGALQGIKVLRVGANYRNWEWEAKDWEKV